MIPRMKNKKLRKKIHDYINKDDYENILKIMKEMIEEDKKTEYAVDGLTPLHMAVHLGDIDLVEFLLKHGEKNETICAETESPLHWAVDNEDNEMIKMLINYGTDINTLDRFGSSIIFWTMERCNREGTEYLLKNGININIQGRNKQTALHHMVELSEEELDEDRYLEFIELLLKYNIDTTLKDKNGNTAIDIAKRKDILEIFKKWNKI